MIQTGGSVFFLSLLHLDRAWDQVPNTPSTGAQVSIEKKKKRGTATNDRKASCTRRYKSLVTYYQRRLVLNVHHGHVGE